MSELQRGASIPAEGEPRIVALCLPDTWTRIVSGLLMSPTQPWFWDNTATPEARAAAVQTAQTILAKFLTADCVCNPPVGQYTQGFWDFTQSAAGWEAVGAGFGTYRDNAWYADIVQLGANRWDARLQIRYTFSEPVRPFQHRAVNFIRDDATTHLGASYAWVASGVAYHKALGETQYGGDLLGWHVGPINPRYVVYTLEGITYIEVGLTASYGLDPTGVVDLYCTRCEFDYYG